MSTEGVHASVKAIQDVEAACARFFLAVVDRLPEIERELRQVSEQLNDRHSQLRREISDLEEQISSADENDDKSWERQCAEDAKGELASISRRIRRLEEVAGNYARHARNVENLTTDHAVRMREFLLGAADELRSYFAAQIESSITGNDQSDSLNPEIRDRVAYDAIQIPQQPPNMSNGHDQKVWADAYLHPNALPLTEAERDALAAYQDRDFGIINDTLCGDREMTPMVADKITLITSAIRKSELPTDVIVIHGAPSFIADDMEPDEIWPSPAFLSTSLSIEPLEQKGFISRGTIIQIYIPRGSKAIYMDELFPPHGDEIEILLPPETPLHIISKRCNNGITWIKASVYNK